MDELEISGKRYISSKRIARENKYHPDYMGQLIRAGKVAGTKVGRAWYVDEESFAAYLGQENSRVNIEPSEPAQHLSIPQDVTTLEQSPVVEPATPEVFVEAQPQIEEKIVREEVFIPERVYVAPVETRKIKLTYLSDSSPLFPEIAPRQKNPQKPSPVMVRKEPAHEGILIQPAHEQKPEKTKIWFFLSATSVVVLGAVVFAFVFFGSVGLDTTVVVENGKPASVELSQEKTFCFIFNTCQNSSAADIGQ